MTLAIPRINEFAEKFYRRFLRQDKPSTDACPDMDDQFIRRRQQYRSKHPETIQVGAAFVRRQKRGDERSSAVKAYPFWIVKTW
jgi:hypothetical protein